MSRNTSRPRLAVLLVALSFANLAWAAPEDTAANALFERAETLYRQLTRVDPGGEDGRSWDLLAEAYAEVPRLHPESPLAPEALWRIADIHDRQRAVRDGAQSAASVAYERLALDYPDHTRAPAALLRHAELVGEGRRESEQASSAYFRLLRLYPQAPEAELARQRLTVAHNGEDEAPATRASAPTTTAEPPPATTPSPSAIVAPVPGTAESPSDLAVGGEEAASDMSITGDPAAADAAAAAADPTPAPVDTTAPARVVGVRHFSDAANTRVVFDLDRPIHHEVGEVDEPPRLFIDLLGADLGADVPDEVDVAGPGLERVRVGVNRPGVIRLVLDLRAPLRYSMFTLANPDRLVVDIPSPEVSERLVHARRPPAPDGGNEARQLNLGVRRIVIDPGHGGSAPGAIGSSGAVEKDLALDIAHRLAGNLRSRPDLEVVLTRDGDESLDLDARPAIANDRDADLFVSIHINASSNRSLSGFETYYLDLATDPAAAETAARENAGASAGVGNVDELLDEIVKNVNKRESRDLAHAIQDNLVLQMTRRYDDVRDLGVKHAPFIVLVGAKMPAVLVETSFLSHEDEETRLRDPDYRQAVADALHAGIESYIEQRRVTAAR